MSRIANRALTKQSLSAAVTAAYVGSWLLLAMGLAWRIHSGADGRICPPGYQAPTDLCTIVEVFAAYLFVFLWALFGVPFGLVLTIVPALVLGRLAPAIENRIGDPNLGRVQYVLGAAAGTIVMLLLDYGLGGESLALSAIAGLLAGAAGVWAFRKARYGQQS